MTDIFRGSEQDEYLRKVEIVAQAINTPHLSTRLDERTEKILAEWEIVPRYKIYTPAVTDRLPQRPAPFWMSFITVPVQDDSYDIYVTSLDEYMGVVYCPPDMGRTAPLAVLDGLYGDIKGNGASSRIYDMHGHYDRYSCFTTGVPIQTSTALQLD